jgi:hypothetical protein
MARYFTVEEANALLPTLRPYVERLLAAWQRLSADQERVVGILDSKPHVDLGGAPLSAAAADIIRAQDAMLAIQSFGVDLKDPASGLLDFPTLRNGVEVYLCWRYGEPRIGFWHSIEGGFAGRQPLDEE